MTPRSVPGPPGRDERRGAWGPPFEAPHHNNGTGRRRYSARRLDGDGENLGTATGHRIHEVSTTARGVDREQTGWTRGAPADCPELIRLAGRQQRQTRHQQVAAALVVPQETGRGIRRRALSPQPEYARARLAEQIDDVGDGSLLSLNALAKRDHLARRLPETSLVARCHEHSGEESQEACRHRPCHPRKPPWTRDRRRPPGPLRRNAREKGLLDVGGGNHRRCRAGEQRQRRLGLPEGGRARRTPIGDVRLELR